MIDWELVARRMLRAILEILLAPLWLPLMLVELAVADFDVAR